MDVAANMTDLGESLKATILLIVVVGAFGGAVRHFLNQRARLQDENTKPTQLLNEIIIGIGGALIAPLFLQILSSKILDFRTAIDYLSFTGVCLVSSVFSERFMGNIMNRLVQQFEATVEKTKTEIKEKTEAIEQTKKEIDKNKEDVTKVSANISNIKGEIDNKLQEFSQTYEQIKAFAESQPVQDLMQSPQFAGFSKGLLDKFQAMLQPVPQDVSQTPDALGEGVTNVQKEPLSLPPSTQDDQ